jgi:hypothetical protein
VEDGSGAGGGIHGAQAESRAGGSPAGVDGGREAAPSCRTC